MSQNSPIGHRGDVAKITDAIIEELKLVTEKAIARNVAYFTLQEVEIELALEISFGPKGEFNIVVAKVELGAEQKRLHTVRVKYVPNPAGNAFIASLTGTADPTAPGRPIPPKPKQTKK